MFFHLPIQIVFQLEVAYLLGRIVYKVIHHGILILMPFLSCSLFLLFIPCVINLSWKMINIIQHSFEFFLNCDL